MNEAETRAEHIDPALLAPAGASSRAAAFAANIRSRWVGWKATGCAASR